MDIVEALRAAASTPRTDETAVADRKMLRDAADEVDRQDEEAQRLIAQFPPSKCLSITERLRPPSDDDSVQDLMKLAAGQIRIGREHNMLLRDRLARGVNLCGLNGR